MSCRVESAIRAAAGLCLLGVVRIGAGSTGTASFASGTRITLTVSNGRDAVWSGACSSGGNKTKSCAFTLSAAAGVTANVQ
jgi:hypothetical protein